MSRIVSSIVLLLFCAALAQCTKDTDPSSHNAVRELTVAEKKLVGATNRFGLKLFREIAEQKTDANICISPLSISMALGSTYNGADGSTQEAMQATLELKDLSLQEVNESYRSLMELLTRIDSKVTFQPANSIWYFLGLSIEKNFIDINKAYFNGEVTGLDFSDPNAPDIINEWINENTNGRIKEIVDDVIDPDVVMFLINAIHFKGIWTYLFDEEKTKDDWFLGSDGLETPCKMMEQRGDYEYFSNEHFQAVDLPYGDGLFSMTIFLPPPGRHIDSLIAQFSQENWDLWTNSLSRNSGDVFLPEFTLEYGDTLNEPLKALGMEIAFTPAANFTKISAGGEIWIFDVIHKSFVEVNEQGTEAAAAASVKLGKGSAPSGFRFRVDRPFLFAIREHHSQAILFLGKISKPPFE